MKIKPHLKEELKKFLVNRTRAEEQKIKVYSAYKLSEDEKKLIKKSVNDFDFSNADYYVDSSLLAGIVIKKGSKVINLSLKDSLLNLKKIVYESD